MAKKSSKSTRRSRAKKEAASKKKAIAPAAAEEAVIIAEGSDEPVVKAPKKAAAKKTPAKKTSVKEAAEQAPEKPAVAEELESLQAIDDMVRPQRTRMFVSAAVLAVVIVASVVVAGLMRSAEAPSADVAPQNSQAVTDPDKLLESGGKVCTNGDTQTNTQQSANPNTVGMMLQSVPAQQIQTPQTYSGSNDAATLQGASCF